MKTKLMLCAFLFATIFTYSQEVEHNEVVYYGEYLPPEITNIGFGLMANTFNNFMIANNVIHNSNKSKTAFVISVSNKPYKSVFYKFDMNLKKLIEVELRFDNENQAINYMLENFNTKKKFTKHKKDKPYAINAWQFRNKVFIVGKIPGSRWGD